MTARAARGLDRLLGSDAGRTSVTRALTLPISGAATIGTMMLASRALSSSDLAFFSIIIAIPALMPIGDLGLGVAVTDTAASGGITSAAFRSTLAAASSALSVLAILVAVVATGVALGGGWATVFAQPHDGDVELASCISLVLVGLGIPLSLAQRLMLGVGRLAVATLTAALGPCVALVVIASLWASGLRSGAWYGLGFLAGSFVSQLVVAVIAFRHAREALKRGAGRPSRPRRQSRARIKSLLRPAWPMTILGVCLPLTYQSDRVLISHVGGDIDVSSYALASSLYMPLLSIITMGSMALWPRFLQLRTGSMQVARPYHTALRSFTLLGIGLATALMCLGPPLLRILYPNRLTPDFGVIACFSLLLVIFGYHSASGMLLMDHHGRVVQAAGAVGMLATKIPVSLWLFHRFGVTGVLVGTIVAMTLWMVIPARLLAGRRVR